MKKLCLIDGDLNKKYKIFELKLEEKFVTHLQHFGLEKDTEIILLKYNYFKTTFLVKFLQINYAVDRKILEGIFVYEWNNFSGKSKCWKDDFV